MSEKTLSELQESLEKVDQLLKTARLFGGKIALDDQIITETELKDLKEDLQFKITAEISNRNLRIVK